MAKQTIIVEGKNIALLTNQESDFISLTDIAKLSDDEPRFIIRNWLSTQSTISYLGAWESLHNPNFNRAGFRTVKDEFFEKPFSLTPTRWLESTDAIGMRTTAGKHGGGTYAHKDIAINFCYWLNPIFQIYLIQEFQRLKEEESERLNLDWNLKRTLAKVNYKIHSDAVRNHLIPQKVKDTQFASLYYASEADLLNLSLFGTTAKEWRENNPELKGNIRDYATAEQLLVMANIENLNAEFIKMGFSKEVRLTKLNEIAIYQIELLVNTSNMKILGDLGNNTKLLE
jgi:KilA-N domain